MHILTLTPFYPTVTDDALGCFIAEPIGELRRLGVDSSVIAVTPRHHPFHEAAPDVPPAVFMRYLALPGNLGLSTAGRFLYGAIKTYVKRLHAERPISLIHAHAALPCGQAGMLLSRSLGIPFVVTVHGLDVFSTRQVAGWLGLRCSTASKEVYARASRVICISEHVAKRIREELGATCKLAVVYNAVDQTLFSPSRTDELPNPVILSVGNLIRIKGHDLLLKAVAQIMRVHAQVRCQIIGNGPELKRLQDLARELGIEDRVHFLGRRPRVEVADAMRKCTVFALPSWYEGLGCVYLEALSVERATIACRGQGIEEIIHHGENGWLIQPNDVGELTDALQGLLSDRVLRESIGRRGRQAILQGFTLADQARKLRSVYEDTLT